MVVRSNNSRGDGFAGPADYFTAPLDAKHKKSAFTCGNTFLDNYIQKQAKQDIEGKLLLIDVLKRSYEVSKVIGSMAVIVDPIDENSIKFYNRFGFITLPDSEKMFLPMKTIEQLFK